MVVVTRWHFVLIAAVILFLSLAQVAHRNAYDVDVLRIVSNTINKDANDASQVNQTAPTAVERTVTITQTITGPTVTETTIVKESGECEECREKNAIWEDAFAAFNQTFDVPANITYDPRGPRADQIVILTATDGRGHAQEVENIVAMATENRQAYADHHGYIHHFIDISKYDIRDIHPVWKKLPAIIETFNTFPEAQWVFWLDIDAIIMSPQQDLQSLILSVEGMRKNFDLGARLLNDHSEERIELYWPQEPDFENVDLIMAQDLATLNAGSFLMRRSHYTKWLLDQWADPFYMYASFERLEQDAIVHFAKHHPTFRQHLGIAKQRAINAYVHVGGLDAQWQKGDLLVHFAGCWVRDSCQEYWTEFWNLREQLRPTK